MKHPHQALLLIALALCSGPARCEETTQPSEPVIQSPTGRYTASYERTGLNKKERLCTTSSDGKRRILITYCGAFLMHDQSSSKYTWSRESEDVDEAQADESAFKEWNQRLRSLNCEPALCIGEGSFDGRRCRCWQRRAENTLDSWPIMNTWWFDTDTGCLIRKTHKESIPLGAKLMLAGVLRTYNYEIRTTKFSPFPLPPEEFEAQVKRSQSHERGRVSPSG
jgi:hypothetical protein